MIIHVKKKGGEGGYSITIEELPLYLHFSYICSHWCLMLFGRFCFHLIKRAGGKKLFGRTVVSSKMSRGKISTQQTEIILALK